MGRSVAYSGGQTGNSNALTNNYIIVGSRPFALTQAALADGTSLGVASLVPAQEENALRQTRWQKPKYPGTTKTALRIGFYPYTMITTGGPAMSEDTPYEYQRPWEGRRWMPMTWAGVGQITPGGGTNYQPNRALRFFGPYMVAELQATGTSEAAAGEFTQNISLTSNVQVVLWLQFSGQK